MFCNASCSNKIWINDVLWAYLSFYQDNCNLLISNCFELLCNVCYWKFLLIVSVVSLHHHQALISCGAKCYFSKLGYQLFLVVFMKKIENQTISFCFCFHSLSVKCRTFLRMALEGRSNSSSLPRRTNKDLLKCTYSKSLTHN